MSRISYKEHSIENLASVLLFGLFVLFLLLMLLFSAQTYRASVRALEENQNLRTAAAYLSTKFHQHDTADAVALADFQGEDALCFKDTIEEKEYVTYIYLKDGELKELFTASGSAAAPDMGTAVASLKSFSVKETPEGFYRVFMEDTQGGDSTLMLHPGTPK